MYVKVSYTEKQPEWLSGNLLRVRCLHLITGTFDPTFCTGANESYTGAISLTFHFQRIMVRSCNCWVLIYGMSLVHSENYRNTANKVTLQRCFWNLQQTFSVSTSTNQTSLSLGGGRERSDCVEKRNYLLSALQKLYCQDKVLDLVSLFCSEWIHTKY